MSGPPPEFFDPYIWDGDYDKQFYWVHLPDGTRVECWPNAGIMMSTDGSGRQWSPEDKPVVSVQRDEESRLYRPDKLRVAIARERDEYARRRGCAVVGNAAFLAAQVLAQQRSGPALLVIDEAGVYDEGQMDKIAEILGEGEEWHKLGDASSIRASGVGTVVQRFDQVFKGEYRYRPRSEPWRLVGGFGEGPGEKMIKERLRAKRARAKKRSKR